jgi:hypothetical protein
MPSPFPGMNPWLEQDDVWHDFHESFVPAIRRALVSQLSPRYIVKLDEEVYVHNRADDLRTFAGRADVLVAETTEGRTPDVAAAVLEAPSYAMIPPAVDVERLSYVEIRDQKSRQLVAMIEVLSPANKKRSDDRAQYLRKRQQLLRSDAHLIELDLLRGGERLPLDDLADCDYCVAVSRAEDRPRVGVWPIRIREPLPIIPVPLLAPDPDARLDLKQILDAVYDEAGYERYIYAGKPQPRLHPDDADWARRFLPG